MKHLTFVTTLSPQQQHEIRRWFLISCALVLLLITSLTCYFAPDVYTLYTLRKEINTLKEKTKTHATLSTTKNTLKKENGALQQKRTHIMKYLTHPKNPHVYITTIINACGDKTTAQLIRAHQKDIEITLLCPTTEHATAFARNNANTDYFSDTRITSLQKHEQKNQFLCTIKGTIKQRI